MQLSGFGELSRQQLCETLEFANLLLGAVKRMFVRLFEKLLCGYF